jgi:hypothetical protein
VIRQPGLKLSSDMSMSIHSEAGILPNSLLAAHDFENMKVFKSAGNGAKPPVSQNSLGFLE